MSWKGIQRMIDAKTFSDCKKVDLVSFVLKMGCKISHGRKHDKIIRGTMFAGLPRHSIIKKGTLISILNQLKFI